MITLSAKQITAINKRVFGHPSKRPGSFSWLVPVWNVIYSDFIKLKEEEGWMDIAQDIREAGQIWEIDSRTQLMERMYFFVSKIKNAKSHYPVG